MKAENESSIIGFRDRNKLGLAGRAVAVAGLAFSASQVKDTAASPVHFIDPETSHTYHLTSPELEQFNTSRVTLEAEAKPDKNKAMSNFLGQEEVRELLGAALVLTALTALYSLRRSRKYEEKALQKLNLAMWTMFTASVFAFEADSFTTIDRHIPAGLATAGLFVAASYSILNAIEGEGNKANRYLAYGAAAGLATTGALLYRFID